MDIEPKILENCTLLQACEWIAFGWEPMEYIYEQALKRDKSKDGELVDNDASTGYRLEASEEISYASTLLRLAIYEEKLIVKGNKCIGIKDNPPFPEDYSCYLNSFWEDCIKEISIKGKDIFLKLYENILLNYPDFDNGTEYFKYKDIQINFNELKKLFPFNEKSKIIKDIGCKYKTIYMQLMEEVIIQENLSDENQGKKEALKGIIVDKMKEHNLPKSDKLADAMATLIRNPSSQAGKNYKHNIRIKK